MHYGYTYLGKLNRMFFEETDIDDEGIYKGLLGEKCEEVFKHALMIGYKMGVSYVSLLFKTSGRDHVIFEEAETSLVFNNYFKLSNNIISRVQKNKYLVLFNLEHLHHKAYHYEEMREYCEGFLAAIPREKRAIKIAIGSIAGSSSEHYRSIYDVEMTMRFMTNPSRKISIGCIEDFLLDEIILSADKKTCSLFLERLIGPLLKADTESILLSTVKTYCEMGYKKARTANALNIHRNTLEYRLEKVSSILDINLENYFYLNKLYLAIMIHENYWTEWEEI